MRKGLFIIFFLTVLVTISLSGAMPVKPVKAWKINGTVYIYDDGSIEPADAPIKTTDKIHYYLTDNIETTETGIIVERANIIINGQGHMLKGNGDHSGIYVENKNITIENLTITNYAYGVDLMYDCDYITISNNSIMNNTNDGIYLYQDDHATVSNNNIVSNPKYGIYMEDSDYATVSNNNIRENGYGIYLYEVSYTTILNNNIRENEYGIYLSYDINNVTISKNKFYNDGINIDTNKINGIAIDENIVNGRPLVALIGADNKVVSNAGQVILLWSKYIKIQNSNLSNTDCGIILYDSQYITISNNIISNDNIGVKILSYNRHIKIYYNDFINNTENAEVWSWSENVYWDNGYPSGGNYWSDYSGVDKYSGPEQNLLGSDGIGDTPYTKDSIYDQYPLIIPWQQYPSWEGFLIINEWSSGYHDILFYGERINASDGQDIYDIPLPPPPPTQSFYAYFKENLSSPYDKLRSDIKQAFNAHYKEWVLKLYWLGNESTEVRLTWSFRIKKLGYTPIILYDYATDTSVDMLRGEKYEFEMDPGTREIYIICTRWFLLNYLHEGWNMIGLPNSGNVSKADLRIYYNGYWYDWNTAVKKRFIVNQIYGWNRTHYFISNTIEAEKGYWLYSFKKIEVWMTIQNSDQKLIANLQKGWNLIGFPHNNPVNLDSLWVYYNSKWYSWKEAISSGIVISYVYIWNGENYGTVNTLEPAYGYWIYANYPCQLYWRKP